ncbi:MAG TPA: bifunctional phosphoribosylaminoimidazolecarboxamide formyltransferase/IMP cyclohydrolase [Dehalococcoidia bacterium]|nr:bifunctional phosphoribosylaminoimidazolecarboxamide formyltransferase/IMP cyclohydrolase [Dehalococcoidia bacterium]
MRALLSVYDKSELVPFARALAQLGWELISTGGTKKALDEAGIPTLSVADVSGSPEILDGRVKTLHPKIHGGILARRDLPEHLEQLRRHDIPPIDLVVANLYPFVETVRRPGVSLREALENIDIGGPAMIRAAAKNFPHVLVVVDPRDYPPLLAMLRKGAVSQDERRRLARKAFAHVAMYDSVVSEFLAGESDPFAEQLTLPLRKIEDLRYGENPHQRAAFYAIESSEPEQRGVPAAEQLHGKQLSYNNILDADAAWNAALDFAEQTVVIVKHTNPCGVASDEDQAQAYREALRGDPISAYGGIVAINRKLGSAAAKELAKTFYEIVIAPDYEPEALDLLRKKRDLRILRIPSARPGRGPSYRYIEGGALVQTPDIEDAVDLRIVTERAPTDEERAALLFAWRCVKHVKSNAIVISGERALYGMGAGQPNRVTSVELALARAGERAKGAVLASDAFFPFADGVEAAGRGGIRAIIQPGGSIRDEEAIQAANSAGMAMVFTGLRHFRH